MTESEKIALLRRYSDALQELADLQAEISNLEHQLHESFSWAKPLSNKQPVHAAPTPPNNSTPPAPAQTQDPKNPKEKDLAFRRGVLSKAIIDHIKTHGPATREILRAALGKTHGAIIQRVDRLLKEGVLLQQGRLIYLSGSKPEKTARYTYARPEDRANALVEKIIEVLNKEPGSNTTRIAGLCHTSPSDFLAVLLHLQKEGLIRSTTGKSGRQTSHKWYLA